MTKKRVVWADFKLSEQEDNNVKQVVRELTQYLLKGDSDGFISKIKEFKYKNMNGSSIEDLHGNIEKLFFHIRRGLNSVAREHGFGNYRDFIKFNGDFSRHLNLCNLRYIYNCLINIKEDKYKKVFIEQIQVILNYLMEKEGMGGILSKEEKELDFYSKIIFFLYYQYIKKLGLTSYYYDENILEEHIKWLWEEICGIVSKDDKYMLAELLCKYFHEYCLIDDAKKCYYFFLEESLNESVTKEMFKLEKQKANSMDLKQKEYEAGSDSISGCRNIVLEKKVLEDLTVRGCISKSNDLLYKQQDKFSDDIRCMELIINTLKQWEQSIQRCKSFEISYI